MLEQPRRQRLAAEACPLPAELESGRFDEAAAALGTAVADYRRLVAQFPDVVDYRFELTQVLLNEAYRFFSRSQAEPARAVLVFLPVLIA